MDASIESVVEKYIKLRDLKSEIANEAKAKIAKLEDHMSKMEAALLAAFEEAGMESVRTKSGTAYRSTRASATVADWDAVLGFVRENEMWTMLERRVSKDAVVQYRHEHNDLPPGVNWREEITVNVRRAA
jgi:hypothetical protein